MRRTLSFSLVLSLLTTIAFITTLRARTAEACGGSYGPPPPRVLDMTWTIDSTLTANGRIEVTPRAFVEIAVSVDPEPANATWTPVSSGSFVTAHLTSETTLPRPVELTLVGPGGIRVVEVTRRALMRDPDLSPNKTSPRLRWVYEVPVTNKDKGKFLYAIEGAHRDAKWTAAGAVVLPPHARQAIGKRSLSGVLQVARHTYALSRDDQGVLYRTWL